MKDTIKERKKTEGSSPRFSRSFCCKGGTGEGTRLSPRKEYKQGSHGGAAELSSFSAWVKIPAPASYLPRPQDVRINRSQRTLFKMRGCIYPE